MRVTIPSWTDNSGTEAICNKLFATVMPLALFARRLATLAWQSSVTLDTSHLVGEHNKLADLLSRWDGVTDLPMCDCGHRKPDCSGSHRCRVVTANESFRHLAQCCASYV